VAVPVGDLLAAPPTQGVNAAAAEPHSPRYIPFSSGTTGLPKGVIHTDASLCGGVGQLQRHLGLTQEDRLQIALPLCHIFGKTMSAAAISVGAELTLFRRFDLDESLRHMRRAGVTIWPIAGAVAAAIAARPDLDAETFASLRFFMWGGSAVPAELAQRITARTGVRFLCSYGMTEAMMVAFNPVDRESEWSLDSPGFATYGTQLRLGSSGELEVRGPSVAVGYSGADSGAFTDDGWFRTGDVARIDVDGRVWIVDRIKDMLKVSGFQVAPAEVEMVLTEHPSVDDAGVVGRTDTSIGEVPVAFVVCRPGAVTEIDLKSWATTRLATYKLPREYRFVSALPRTSAGKLRRAELRALLVDPSPQDKTSTSAVSD
jgi:long-chain acyl-CoA synthetase